MISVSGGDGGGSEIDRSRVPRALTTDCSLNIVTGLAGAVLLDLLATAHLREFDLFILNTAEVDLFAVTSLTALLVFLLLLLEEE